MAAIRRRGRARSYRARQAAGGFELPAGAVMGGVTTQTVVYPQDGAISLGEGMTQAFASTERGRRATEAGQYCNHNTKECSMPSIVRAFQERRRRRSRSRSRRSHYSPKYGRESLSTLAERLRRRKRTRTRSRSRRTRERRRLPPRTATGKFTSRKRSRSRRRSRTRSRRRTRESVVAKVSERKRRRRSRRSRSRRSHRSREAFASFMGELSERKRRRRSRRRSRSVSRRRRSRRRSRETGFAVLAERRRRRSRRTRRTGTRRRRSSRTGRFMRAREMAMLMERRRPWRRRSRSRRTYRTRESGLGFLALAERRRHRYSRHMPRRRGREGRFFGEMSGPAAPPASLSIGRRPNAETLYRGVFLPALTASIGLIAGRVTSDLLTTATAKFAPGSPTLQKWIGPTAAFVSPILLWWLGGTSFSPNIWRRNRGLIAVGAAMHFVEEILAIVMPKIISPTSSGVLARALYGDQAGVGGLGQCSVGCPTCAGLPTVQQPCVNVLGLPPNASQLAYGFPAVPTAVGRLEDWQSHSLGGGLGQCSVGCPTCAGLPTTQQPCVNVLGVPPNASQLAYGFPAMATTPFVPPQVATTPPVTVGGGPASMPNARNIGPGSTASSGPVGGIAGAAAANSVKAAGINDPWLAGYAMGNATETERILNAAGMNGLGGPVLNQ